MMNLQDKRDGEFQNELGVWFTFRFMKDEDGSELRKSDREFINCMIDMQDGTFRYALLLKTRVHVAVDEDESSYLVFERWHISKLNLYKN